MKLIILTPTTKLFEGEVKSVNVPGFNGKFQILNNHAPIISLLTEGVIVVRDNESKIIEFQVKKGILESSNNNIKILAEQ